VPERTVLVSYRGRVQGVGFRATVRRLAADFDARGWVKNEADGSVSLIATADAAALDRFLQAIRTGRLGACIEREEVEDAAPSVERGFDIRY
jgi:acylphosphatase